VSELAADTHRRFLYRSADALLDDIHALGLEIPWQDDVSPLLEPVHVGDRVLPNRLATHPMEGFDSERNGAPGESALRRYGRFAGGGAGLLWCEATAVVPEGRSNPRQLWLHEGSVAEFRRMVERARRSARESNGADHDPLMILQLTHSGRWSKTADGPRPIVPRHAPTLDGLVGIGDDHPVITDDELDRLQDVFVAAARLAATAGFDGVDVKACHGYLCSELLGCRTREGRYGGALENRARFLLETVARIREEVPRLLVTTRMNVYDGIPLPWGFGVGEGEEDPPRPDLAEPLRVLREMIRLGAPLANITLGVPYTNPHLGRPFNRAVPGSPSAPEHPLVGVARFQTLTGALQAALPDLPLVGTGYSWLRHFFPHVGAAAVKRGAVSIVGVGRMAISYPDFARDLVRNGSLSSRKTCVGCSGCSHLMKAGMPAGCVVRDGDIYQVPPNDEKGGGR
jgi:2,4-dienoyl-CoA reductase (NADPH2)